MGYDLHITRRTDWPDDGSSITFDDWMAVASADPELRPDGYLGLPLATHFASRSLYGQVIRTMARPAERRRSRSYTECRLKKS